VGVACEILDRRGMETLQPGVRFRSEGAVYYPNDAHLVPALFVEQLKSLVLRQGVKIREGVRFLGWERGGSGVGAIRTSEGSFRADDYVLAGGAWSGVLARRFGLRMPLEAGKGYSLTTPAPSWPGTVPLLLSEDRVAITPLGGALRFAGTMEIAGLDERVTMHRVRAIARAVPRYLELPEPSLHGQIWAGLRPCSPDGLPYIGRFGQAPNLIAATGHAMLGLTLAPVTGKIVADIVARRSPTLDLSVLSPDRFAHS
jgi:D-amino-acid dehydrogenase